MFRRRRTQGPALDRAALEANCAAVVAELAEDFDWHLPAPHELARTVAARIASILVDDPALGADLGALRRLLEREACAEHFADLYDGMRRGSIARETALTELFHLEEESGPDGPRLACRGYLYRAARLYLQRWSGRHGWSPAAALTVELARAAAEDVQVTLLRGVELREGRRAFWAYLSRGIERRTIDQLRAHGRREGTVSLEATLEQWAAHGAGEFPAAGGDPQDAPLSADGLSQLMHDAGLSVEERFALIAGAYGYNDTEAATELTRRLGRTVGPPDIRRWRFRGREKLRKTMDAQC